MSGSEYFCLSIDAPTALVPHLTELLAELGHTTLEERPAPRGTTLLVYGQVEAALEEARAAVERSLADSGQAALSCTLTPVDPSWALAWTQHLDVVQLTPSLRLVPAAVPGAGASPSELYLEPAFAFGFGEHASTRLAAAWLEACCQRHAGARVLDIGTGTGVLALVAARSGAGSVLGLDTSEAAITAARYNAAQNGVAERCRFESQPLGELSAVFDVVIANIEGPILHELAPLIVTRLSRTGVLALAGFIDEQVAGLVRRYAALGVALRVAAEEDEWRLLVAHPLPAQ